MPRLTPILLALLSILPPAFSSPFPTPFNTQPGQPIPPSQALASIRTPPGLTASLFASEPQVQQPIAIATDPQGRLWVAENYTYGEAKVGFDLSLRDRIVILEDSDHDGLADRRTVFTDQLQRLSSIELGFNGVWVLAPPQLLFFPDKNHDDQPDSPPVVLLDGFDSGPVRHNLANGLRWGPDGWLYGRHGIQATSLVGPPNTPPNLRTPINCGIWRYHPTRKIFEVVASGTTNPWGLDWDRFGEAFFTNTVIGHLWHLIPGAHYDRMYGKDLTPHTYELLPQHADHLHWDNTGQWQKAGREKNGADSFGGGHAHEGCLIYQGNSWPAEFHNQLFTINFYGRRLNREELLPQGSGYLASHLPDLLHIGDPWFRGTDLLPASDGSVFLADWSDTGECHENDGVHRTSGRIYQISATKKSPPPPDLTPLSNLQLVALQQSPNQWLVRQSRLLLASRATIAPLEDARLALLKLFHSPNPHNPQLALHALWTLHAINAASTPLLLETLNHPHPHLRIWAIRLLTDDPSSLLSPPDAFLRLAATDPSPAVRLALASALQRFPPTARPPLARPLLAHSEDALDHNLPLLLWYGLIPLGDSHPDLLADLLAHSQIPTTSRLIARRLAESLPTLPQTIEPLLSAALAASPTVQAAILSGLATGLKKTPFLLPPPLWPKLSASLALISNPSVQSDLATLNRLFLHSQNLAQLAAQSLDPSIPTPLRLQSLNTLSPNTYPHFHDLCSQLLNDPALRLHAAPLLAKLHDPRDSTPLLHLATLLPPSEQLLLFTTLASELPHASALLEKILDHSLPISILTPALEKSLRSHGNELIDKLFDAFYSTNPPPLSPATP